MGDFVSGRKGKDCGQVDRSLFDSLKEEGTFKETVEHSPILEFQMFGVVERSGEIDGILADWKKESEDRLKY